MHTVSKHPTGDWRIYLRGFEVFRGYETKEATERMVKDLDEQKRKRDAFYINH